MDIIGFQPLQRTPKQTLQTRNRPSQTQNSLTCRLVVSQTFLLNLLNLCELFSDFSKFCVTLWEMG